MHGLVLFTITLGLLCLTRPAMADPTPATALLPGAHAHNDYEYPRPLLDALDHGFQSVEADVFLIGGDLLVAHDREDVRPERILRALYLDPLLERVREHRGQVYPASPEPFYLLIDFKSEGASTYRALHRLLQEYREMFTEFGADETQRRAVTAIISGNRPKELIAKLQPQLAGHDGRLADLETADPQLTPWISDNWTHHFKWRGESPVPEADRVKLRTIVQRAHARDLQVRFWSIPDQPAAWRLLRDAKVDFINTDRLEALCRFLQTPNEN